MDETREQLFDSRLVFTRALDAIIPEGRGIFIVIDDIDLIWEINNIIIHKTNGQIGILDAEDRTDLEHGDWVTLIDEDTLKN